MNSNLGFIEYRSIARGIRASDLMLKSSRVKLEQSLVLCPGKYVTLISGDLGSVIEAVKNGAAADPAFAISSFVLPNIHPAVLSALCAVSEEKPGDSLGIVETEDLSSAVIAADTAAKASEVVLHEIRLGRGMGGKSFVAYSGSLSAAQAAMKAVVERIGEDGVLLSTAVIPNPHPDLIRSLAY